MERILTDNAIEMMEACQGFRAQGIEPSASLNALEDGAIKDLADYIFNQDDKLLITSLKYKYNLPMNGYELLLASQFAGHNMEQINGG